MKNPLLTGKFDIDKWPTDVMISATAIKKRLEDFRLVGRTIAGIKTIGRDYEHSREKVKGSGHFGYVSSKIVIDEPLLIAFEGGDCFEVLAGINPEFFINMNTLSWWISYGINPPNIQVDKLFKDCIGSKIVAVEVETKILKKWEAIISEAANVGDEVVEQIILWLDNGKGIAISSFIEDCIVDYIDSQKKTIMIPIYEAEWALLNRDDVPRENMEDFELKSSDFSMGAKGRLRVGLPYYRFYAEDDQYALLLAEKDARLWEWAISIVAGWWINIYSSRYVFDYHDWHRILEEANKMVSFNTFDELFDYLLIEKGKIDNAKDLLYSINNHGADFWKDRERYKLQVEDMKAWSSRMLNGSIIVTIDGDF